MIKPIKPKFRLISETIPDRFISKVSHVCDIIGAIEEFFEDNFRGAIITEASHDTDGYLNISTDGFAFFHKVLLNAIFGESVVRLRMFTDDASFKVEARWKVYKRISESDLALLESTAKLSGFTMRLSDVGEDGFLLLEMPIRKTPKLAIYAVSKAQIYEAFTRVFFF